MNNLNVDLAVEYVKNIVDKNKCVSCDHLQGPYVRYPCGHFICQKCVATAEECLLCLSPPAVSTHFIDKPLTRRVEHISNLLTEFQELLNIDVFKRHRISEQLKLERQLFPECIQAPSKYCNKRKSSNISVLDKENITSSYIAGENTSYIKPFKMEDSNYYVQHWLDTNITKPNKSRKPFADLKVNCNYSNIKSIDLVKNNVNEVVSKKRTHNKKLSYESKKLKQSPKAIKKQHKKKELCLRSNETIKLKNNKLDNNDSGIDFEDHTIVIDESQNDVFDKDKLACLAVIEAEKNNVNIFTDYETTQCSSIRINDVSINTKTIKAKSMLPLFKVPFYRKSSLYEVCSLYSQNTNERMYRNNADNVTVTIENNNFVATINILHNKENSIKLTNKHSVEIQTIDVNDENENNVDQVNIPHGNVKNKANKANILLYEDLMQSENKQGTLLLDNKPKEQAIKLNSVEVKGVIVAESETDSDTDNEHANTIETIADVHASAQFAYGILSTLEPNQYEHRQQRKAIRGNSPISTDSSDKENYDPNRAKRQKFDKKSKKYNC
ncbi:unnamed protein product, partial [Brenthis ino]